jgi:hypothetical protein
MGHLLRGEEGDYTRMPAWLQDASGSALPTASRTGLRRDQHASGDSYLPFFKRLVLQGRTESTPAIPAHQFGIDLQKLIHPVILIQQT